MPVVDKLFPIKTIQASQVSSDPECSFTIDAQAHDHITAQAAFNVRIMQLLFESIFFPVKINQSTSIGANPYITKFVFNKLVDIIKWQTI